MGLLKGLLHRHQEPIVEDDDGPAWQPLPDLDLRDVHPSTEELTWGRPSRCPSCGAAGYLDHIDVEHHVMYQHCPWCWTKWDTVVES